MFEANKILESTTALLIDINKIDNEEARVRLSQELLFNQAEYINAVHMAAGCCEGCYEKGKQSAVTGFYRAIAYLHNDCVLIRKNLRDGVKWWAFNRYEGEHN
jgi:hypothetical protein